MAFHHPSTGETCKGLTDDGDGNRASPSSVGYLVPLKSVLSAGYARVLVTSSVESQQGSPGYMPYNAAKWSLMAFQEEWVNTHAVNSQSNIQVVTILPGTVNTSLGYTGIFGEHSSCPFSIAVPYLRTVCVMPLDSERGGRPQMAHLRPCLRGLIRLAPKWQ